VSPRHIRVLERFYALRIGEGWRQSSPRSVSTDQALQALWQLNDLYQQNYQLIASLSYASTYEKEADQALEKLVLGGAWSGRDPKPIVWRVLLERQHQSMVVVLANELHNNDDFCTIPSELPEVYLPHAIALFLQFEMKLILEPKNKLPAHWPPTGLQESFSRH
jgi:hypothetical protein